MTTLRRAGRADVSALAELALRAYQPHADRIGFPPPPMVADYAAAVRDEEVWVMEVEGSVVALLVLVAEPECLLVKNVAVEPERQGGGLGSELLRYAEARARELGAVRIRLYTHALATENIALYQRRGYVETHRDPIGDSYRVHLAKPVGS